MGLMLGSYGCAVDPCVIAPDSIITLLRDSDQLDIAGVDDIIVCEVGAYRIVAAREGKTDSFLVYRSTDDDSSPIRDAVFSVYAGAGHDLDAILRSEEAAERRVDYTLWQDGKPVVTATDTNDDRIFDKIKYEVLIDGYRDYLTVVDRNYDGSADYKWEWKDGENTMWVWVQGAWRHVHQDASGHTIRIDGESHRYEWNGTEYEVRAP